MPSMYYFEPGRRAKNSKDLTNTTHGALHCEGESHRDNGLKHWHARCLCCDNRTKPTTYILKQGRCRRCGATKPPAETTLPAVEAQCCP